jgi:hypothetical protein
MGLGSSMGKVRVRSGLDRRGRTQGWGEVWELERRACGGGFSGEGVRLGRATRQGQRFGRNGLQGAVGEFGGVYGKSESYVTAGGLRLWQGDDKVGRLGLAGGRQLKSGGHGQGWLLLICMGGVYKLRSVFHRSTLSGSPWFLRLAGLLLVGLLSSRSSTQTPFAGQG